MFGLNIMIWEISLGLLVTRIRILYSNLLVDLHPGDRKDAYSNNNIETYKPLMFR